MAAATAFSGEAATVCLRLAGVPTPRPAAPEPWGEVFCPGEQVGGAAAIVRLSGEGTWQFSLAEDDDWRDCGSIYHGRALLSGPAGRLRFLPVAAPAERSVFASHLGRPPGQAGARVDLAGHGRLGGDSPYGKASRAWAWMLAPGADVTQPPSERTSNASGNRSLSWCRARSPLWSASTTSMSPANSHNHCRQRRKAVLASPHRYDGDADGADDAFGDRFEDRRRTGAHGQAIAGDLASCARR